MATRYLNLTGKIKYANSQYGSLFEPDPSYGNYKINFYPDPASWERFKSSGLKLDTKTDDDGDYVVFRRPHEKLIKGETQVFGRPKVFFAEEIKDEATRDIGNGSSAKVSVSVYGEGRYIGHRLESVTITELVKYTGGRGAEGVEFKDGKNDPVERAKKEDEGSEQPKEEKPKVQSKGGKPFDDEIPFDGGKPVRKPTPFKR